MTYYDLNMNSARIRNCLDPIIAQDVATKNYVDTSFTKTPTGATVLAEQTTASATYTDLATVGPSVTATTGTSCIISISCKTRDPDNNADTLYMAIAVSGATTIAANDNGSISAGFLSISNQGPSISRTFRLTGLTAGSNTFTAKYRVAGGGTGYFSLRDIVVFP